MGKTDAQKILAVKPEGKKPFGRHSRRWIIISNWMCAEREWLRVGFQYLLLKFRVQ
jgi:hypothetical protein